MKNEKNRRRNDNVEALERPNEITKNERYLTMAFNLLKRREQFIIADKKTHFSDTEIRLIAEVIAARYQGKRLISTQLADLLGVTRSAVSQIVNRLEMQGFVQRVPDAVDKKIAYIEITEETKATYGKDLDICLAFIGKAVEKFGEANFEKMYALMCGFIDVLEELRADWQG